MIRQVGSHQTWISTLTETVSVAVGRLRRSGLYGFYCAG
jgi:hypothetical protein